MGRHQYIQISSERFNIINERYQRFLDRLSDPTKEPIKVFDPLTEKQLNEIDLIREVSKDLQAKKEEDVTKAAKAAKQAEEEAAKEAEKMEQKENAEEKKEEEKEENKA